MRRSRERTILSQVQKWWSSQRISPITIVFIVLICILTSSTLYFMRALSRERNQPAIDFSQNPYENQPQGPTTFPTPGDQSAPFTETIETNTNDNPIDNSNSNSIGDTESDSDVNHDSADSDNAFDPETQTNPLQQQTEEPEENTDEEVTPSDAEGSKDEENEETNSNGNSNVDENEETDDDDEDEVMDDGDESGKKPWEKESQNVAISILITKDPGTQGGFLDSAAALVVAIEEAQSKHNITLLAIVHRNVTKCRPILKVMGYQIREENLPLEAHEIRNPKIAKEIIKDGCCGIAELLKLHNWRYKEFDVVLSLDADCHFHKNFDELFDLKTTLGWTHGATANINQELMNGGFLIIRPNVTHYKEMVEIIKEGDFRDGSAWRGSGVGWVYGGRTIQGIVPYYYLKVRPNDETEFPRCKYNNMVEIQKCKNWTYPQVTGNHFTVCQKPWYCIYQHIPLCDAFAKKWWERRHMVEEKFGLKIGEECPRRMGRRKYEPIDFENSEKFKEWKNSGEVGSVLRG